MSARALYICYLSLADPLVRTQVVAYLAGLAQRGHTIHLLTFEPELSPARRREFRAEMAALNITWHGLRYHKRPSLPATIYDTLAGAAATVWLVLRHRLEIIHARNHVPLAMALLVQPLVRRKLIFDIRGLMAEEYADAGRWTRDGAPYRLTEWIQGVGLRRADGFVVLTQRVRRKLWGEQPANVQVIPCCVDFERLAPGERDVRAELRLGDGPVMIYLGKLTGVYMDREMAVFFSVARRDRPDLTFLVVTQSPAESIVDELGRAGLQADAYRITSAPSADVGAYLAAADFAICFCHPKPSLIAASPTKVGEYLAAGLPVVSGPDVGDTDAVLSANRAGVIVERFDDESYAHASATVLQQVADGETAARCRQVAHDVFSLRDVAVPRYDALYRTLGRTR